MISQNNPFSKGEKHVKRLFFQNGKGEKSSEKISSSRKHFPLAIESHCHVTSLQSWLKNKQLKLTETNRQKQSFKTDIKIVLKRFLFSQKFICHALYHVITDLKVNIDIYFKPTAILDPCIVCFLYN